MTSASSISISQNQSAALYYLRSLALTCILLCHLLEAYGNPWSATFYVGVPLFFFLSGYLISLKTPTDWKNWFAHRWFKLGWPYLLFIVPVLLLYLILCPEILSWPKAVGYFFNLQGLVGCVPGLNHLWFMTAIMVCYALVPLLCWLSRWSNALLPFCWLVFLLDVMLFQGRFYWLPLYGVAYFSARANRDVLKWVVGCIALAAFVQVFTWYRQLFFPLPQQYIFGRAIVAYSVLFGLIFLFKKFGIKKTDKVCLFINRLSYPLFLVHNLFMVGPFSVVGLTAWPWLDVFVMITLSVLYAFVLSKCNRRSPRKSA